MFQVIKMKNEIVLNPETLLNWDFKLDARGYRPQEVDKFLDLVINDYNEFITEIKELKKENYSQEQFLLYITFTVFSMVLKNIM